jgi:hypothetical protein
LNNQPFATTANSRVTSFRFSNDPIDEEFSNNASQGEIIIFEGSFSGFAVI